MKIEEHCGCGASVVVDDISDRATREAVADWRASHHHPPTALPDGRVYVHRDMIPVPERAHPARC